MISSRKYDDVITMKQFFYKIENFSWYPTYLPSLVSFGSGVQEKRGGGEIYLPAPWRVYMLDAPRNRDKIKASIIDINQRFIGLETDLI